MRHHYTPRFYLEHFVDGTGVLHVVSRQDGHRYTSTPAGVGFENDFYKLDDVPKGEDPHAVEKAFAELEGEFAPVLNEVISTRAIPADAEKFNTLMNFVALAATRVPTTREAISEPMAEAARMRAQIMVSSKERFEAICRGAGIDPAAKGINYEGMREFVANNMVVEIPTAAYVNHMMTMIDVMLPLLANRNWCLCYNDALGRNLVVTDRPVSLSWSEPIQVGFFGPGFAMPGTDVVVPLSSEVALLGRFEELPLTMLLDRTGVASVNSKTMGSCQRFVATASDDFECQDAALNIISDRDVVELIKRDNHGAKPH